MKSNQIITPTWQMTISGTKDNHTYENSFDSNVLISAIGKESEFRIIWDSFLINAFSIVITPSILLEYEEILQQKAAPGASDLVIEIFKEIPNVIFRDTYYNWQMIWADEDDNKFFDAVVAEQVDYLVTNDHHFDEAIKKGFPFVNIISASKFKTIIEK